LARAVLLVAGRDPESERGGGHSSYVRAHARAVAAAGFEPHLVCVARESGRFDADYGTVHRVASPFRPFRQLMIPGHDRVLAPAIADLAARLAPGPTGAPTLIHAFGVWGCSGVGAAKRIAAAGGRAVALLSTYTTYEDESRSKAENAGGRYGPVAAARFRLEHLWIRLAVERFERRGYLGSDAVLFNYESVRRLVLAKFGARVRLRRALYAAEAAFDAAPVSARPRDTAAIDALAPADAPLVVAVSRHDPRKGVDVLLDALALLRQRGVPFRACLVGEGPLLAANRALARQLDLGASTVLAGLVPDAVAYLGRADVYVLPSRREQSGSLAVLEAMQAGRAIVASACDGIPEDVVDGESALLVEPGDARSLAGALSRTLGDEALRRRLGETARRRFAERFSAAAFTADLRRVYADFGLTP
jgi:glycosyltransferase involved in cell wall biosynthesis